MSKKILDKNYFDDEGDIIDRVIKEEEYLKQQQQIPDISLNVISDYYHKRLSEDKELQEHYGFNNPLISNRFNIGYCDGTLIDKVSDKQKKELITRGILTETGTEILKDMLTIPVYDANDEVKAIVGTDIDDNIAVIGDKNYLFNFKASKVYDNIILCDSVITALSLISSGCENVLSIHKIGNLEVEDLKRLRDNRVKIVTLAFLDKISADLCKDIFLIDGFKVKMIEPAFYSNWNDELKHGLKAEVVRQQIEKAELFKPHTDDSPLIFEVTRDNLNYIFQIDRITYRLAGVKDMFISNLKVNIRAESDNEKYFDNLDLYSARSRNSYSINLSKVFNIEPKRIEKDLVKILEYLENERDKRLETGKENSQQQLTDEEVEIGLDFLKSDNLFDQIVDDMSVLGYVGEDLNKLLLYLCATSRLMDDPISVMIVSQSASGKSFLVDTVKKLIPADEVIAVTSLSDQALNYIPDLVHKFLILGEAVHNEIIEHQIREMLSNKELTRLVTIKDEKTGKLSSKIIKTPVNVASAIGTTSNKSNPENVTRFFLINADESKEQTRKIHELQRNKYSLKRYNEKRNLIPDIIKRHHFAQRLLNKIVIINPFGRYIDFPDDLMRSRRDNDRFIDLIACVCFLRQYQKETKTENEINYIECDLTDYEIARNIMVNQILPVTFLDLPQSAIDLYELIRNMLQSISKREQVKPTDISFIQREVREFSRLNGDTIRKNIKLLVDYEYIHLIGGRNKGTRFSYKLREDKPIDKIDLSIIPTVDEIKGKMGEKTAKNINS